STWGAPRIRGELPKLGIDIGQTTVAKYMAKRRRPPSQGRKTFLRNHADVIASMDLFVVPTRFDCCTGCLFLQHSRWKLLWLGVTTHPNAQWIGRQVTEACDWCEVPRYVVCDRDAAYGEAFAQRLAALGIRDRQMSARSPWQNGQGGAADRLDPTRVP